MNNKIQFYWIEEDGRLLIGNEPSRLANFVLTTNFKCPIKDYCVPFSVDEMKTIKIQDNPIDFIQSEIGINLLEIFYEEMAW